MVLTLKERQKLLTILARAAGWRRVYTTGCFEQILDSGLPLVRNEREALHKMIGSTFFEEVIEELTGTKVSVQIIPVKNAGWHRWLLSALKRKVFP